MPTVDESTLQESPTTADRSEKRRFTGLLPNRLLHHRKPRWWQELALIAFCYWIYTLTRNAIPQQEAVAQRHARSVESLQSTLHLNFEKSVNHFVAGHEALAQVMDYYYATLHFVITIGVLIWLFHWRPNIYRGVRTVLFGTTVVALAGFYFYPLAPPRLMPGSGYIDTLAVFHTWGSLADPSVAQHSNQFAAMPSLHIGWALWCAVAIARSARHLWVRILGAGYPIFTFFVIIGTANHFIIDAVGGIVVFAIGLGIQYLASGHSAYRPAPEPGQRGES